MKCLYCKSQMEVEESFTALIHGGKEIEIRERCWCPVCNHTLTHIILYKQAREWSE